MTLLETTLPKWPQMLVAGHPVTENQALEIIRRTDAFFVNDCSGNNHQRIEKIKRMVSMPILPRVITESTRSTIWDEHHDSVELWKKSWGALPLYYPTNEWVSTSFVDGPHGWMHPDGGVFFCDNIGKWPQVVSVLEEWQTIAKAFPFLTLGCILMSGERCEEDKKPLAAIEVKSGEAFLSSPSDDLFKPYGFKTLEHVQAFATGYERGRDLYALHRCSSLPNHHENFMLDMESAITLQQIHGWATDHKEVKYNGLPG